MTNGSVNLESTIAPQAKELTEDDYDQMERQQNEKAKKEMFEALIKLDFTSAEEISLKKMINMPYKVTDEDEDVMMNNQSIVKILKM